MAEIILNGEFETVNVLLISVFSDNREEDKVKKSLFELEELINTAVGESCECFYMTQCRPSPEAATYIGKGKIDEAHEICVNKKISLVVADTELSPSQIKNLEDELCKKRGNEKENLDVRVIDRTMLILDIFAKHAVTGEGKLQVEIAQLKYTSPRLTGKGKVLSRQGGGIAGGGNGGIGARGPGESKLETDRRYIKRRISALEDNLKEMEADRAVKRKKREKSKIPVVAITGYTNAGKSSLLNYLTNAGILAKDMLFATLDPTVRNLTLPNGREILLSDTVGFISNLPHKLVEAFKSTLEEAKYADVIIIVSDISDPECENKTQVTEDTLCSLGVFDKPVIYAFNKSDLCDILPPEKLLREKNSVCISAKTGLGVDTLLNMIEDALNSTQKRVKFLFPFSNQTPIGVIHGCCHIISEEYTEDGTLLVVIADEKICGKYKDYIV